MSFSNTYDTTNPGSAVSNREDLTEFLTSLSPEDTPVLSGAQKQRASATDTEWTVDKMDDPSTEGVTEGSDVTAFSDKFAQRARMGNFTQLFRRSYKVSQLQEAVDSVGPAKLAQAEAKAVRELKRDIEKTLCSTNIKQQATASLPYKMNGLGAYIDSSPVGDVGVPAGFETPASSINDLKGNTVDPVTETELNDIIGSIYDVNGEVNNLTLIANTKLRRTISDFARLAPTAATSGAHDRSIRSVNYEGGSADITLRVDLYQSDHGIISVINGNPLCMPDFGQSNNKASGYIVNSDYYGIHELIPMGTSRLPNDGGGERGYVDCALTLGVYHPQAHGLIKGNNN